VVVAEFGLLEDFRSFDDALRDRLRCARDRKPPASIRRREFLDSVWFSTTRIHGSGGLRRSYSGGGFYLLVVRLGFECNHGTGRPVFRFGTLAQAALKIGQLLNDVAAGNPAKLEFLGTALAVGKVAEATCENVRGAGRGDDLGIGRMAGRMPIRRAKYDCGLCAWGECGVACGTWCGVAFIRFRRGGRACRKINRIGPVRR